MVTVWQPIQITLLNVFVKKGFEGEYYEKGTPSSYNCSCGLQNVSTQKLIWSKFTAINCQVANKLNYLHWIQTWSSIKSSTQSSKSNLSSNSDSIIRTSPTTNLGYRSLPSDVTVLFSFRSHFKLKKTIKLDSVFSKNQWENWEKLNFQINFTLSTKAFQSCETSLLLVTYSSTFFISSPVQCISNISFYL